MKLTKILAALAVFAAAVIVPAGCDNLAGSGNGSETAFTEAAAAATGSAGGTLAAAAAGTKIIKVKFNVKNGGYGLVASTGLVSAQDDIYVESGGGIFAEDFTIAITVPASDEYVNIRWRSDPLIGDHTYVKAKMKPESGTITVDYNGYRKVAAKNLYDVRVGGWDDSVSGGEGAVRFEEDWKDAGRRSVHG